MIQKFSVFEGIGRRNMILSQGMVIAPIVLFATTLENALILSLAFSCLTFSTVGISSFYPKSWAYALRVILYLFTAALLYPPTLWLCKVVFADLGEVENFLPLLTVNSLIVLHSQLHFHPMKRHIMFPTLLFYCLGFCVVAIGIGMVRELISLGTIYGNIVDMPLLLKGFSGTWGGFLLIGLSSALHRVLFAHVREEEL